MPTFYNFRENGLDYSFDDIFVPADLFREGTLFTWGNGALGDNSGANRSTPVTTSAGGANWKQVSSGGSVTAAIKTDGTLWTWGDAAAGRLGNGITAVGVTRFTPVTTFAGGTNWKQVSCGGDHTAAIKTDGTLWTWGNSGGGRLGNGVTTGNRSTPVTTFAGGNNWKQVSCEIFHTAAIKTDGTLWTWGNGIGNQLGINSTTNKSTPITTFAGGTNWKQVSCGGDGTGSAHTAAIKTDGTLWTWGTGISGQLGDNSMSGSGVPVTTFAGGTNWKQVSARGRYTAAIKTDGTLWTWGYGNTGQLGNAATTSAGVGRNTPLTTFSGGTNWKQVVCCYGHTAAIKTDGTLWTWGQAGVSIGGGVVITTGKLGNGVTIGNISTPVTTFAGGTNWKQVSGAGSMTAAVTYIDPVI